MEDLANEKASGSFSDDELFMREVVKGEPELFLLDCYLREIFGQENI